MPEDSKESEIEVLDEGFVIDVAEPVGEPKVPALLNTCTGCKESFSVPLVSILNQPYCGACVLKGGAFTLRLGGAALQSLFGRFRRKAKHNG